MSEEIKTTGLTYAEALAAIRVDPTLCARHPSFGPGEVLALSTAQEKEDMGDKAHPWILRNTAGGSVRPANLSADLHRSQDWSIGSSGGNADTDAAVAEARRLKEEADAKAIADRAESENAVNPAVNPDPSKRRPGK